MSRDNIYAAQMRDKFAREALMDLPSTATQAERQEAERRARIAREDHGRAASQIVATMTRLRTMKVRP